MVKKSTATEMNAFRNIFICFLFAVATLPSYSQKLGGEIHIDPKDIVMKWRAGFMSVISFYTPNLDYMGATKATQGFGLSFKGELNFPETKKMKLLMGLEYLDEGLTFDSYYFSPGYSVLYDKNFTFTHKVHIHELYVPILMKLSINNENDHTNSVYLTAGWSFRYLLGAQYKITNKADSKIVAKGFSVLNIEERHRLLTDNGGGSLQWGIGMEHRIPNMKQGWIFEVQYRYNLARYQYIGNNNTNNILFRNNNLSISVGYEF